MESSEKTCFLRKVHPLILVVVVALVAGASAYLYGFQKGFMNAKERVLAHQLGSALRPVSELTQFAGTVTGTTEKGITIKLQGVGTGPFDDPDLLERSVLIASDTKITKRTPGDMESYRKAQEDFMKKIQSGVKNAGAPPMPPEVAFTSTALSGIKVDDVVVVTTKENVASEKSFTALEIQVQ